MQVDLFCRVVDNFGDLGVCWRLARRLVQLGCEVRFWVDDLHTFAQMQRSVDPAFARQPLQTGITLLRWPSTQDPGQAPDLVIEAFACELPPAYLTWLRAICTDRQPVWINLEYLSAEPWVDHCHALPSPQGGGWVKHFFFPGFGGANGGLLIEPDAILAESQIELHSHCDSKTQKDKSLRAAPSLQISVFAYPDAPRSALVLACIDSIERLGLSEVVLHIPESQVRLWNGAPLHPQIRLEPYAWLDPKAFDALLARCDLNLVRGEDSFVRAQLVGRPMLWHIYPQEEAAHVDKLQAWVDRYLGAEDGPKAGSGSESVADSETSSRTASDTDSMTDSAAFSGVDSEATTNWQQPWRRALAAWNGECNPNELRAALPELLAAPAWQAYQAHALNWARALRRGPELAEQILSFTSERRRL